MAAKSNELWLFRLKKQIKLLQKRERQHRHKLRAALQKIRKVGTVYKTIW